MFAKKLLKKKSVNEIVSSLTTMANELEEHEKAKTQEVEFIKDNITNLQMDAAVAVSEAKRANSIATQISGLLDS